MEQIKSIEVVDQHAVVTSQDGVTDESQSPSVRLLVVDDQALMRDGLASLLSLEQGITVVGTASNGEEASAR